VFDSANPDFYIAHVDILRKTSTDVGPTGLRLLPDFMQRLSRLPVISIASIRGRARGIGIEFIEGLDMRFGSREKMIWDRSKSVLRLSQEAVELCICRFL
jgi:enoyl-CoA hydratase/carnithine racemase